MNHPLFDVTDRLAHHFFAAQNIDEKPLQSAFEYLAMKDFQYNLPLLEQCLE